MRDETITAFLDQLAARVPAPGGGATAALHAAQSAALLAMVARYSNGAKYDADLMDQVITEADGIRERRPDAGRGGRRRVRGGGRRLRAAQGDPRGAGGPLGRHRRGPGRGRAAARRRGPASRCCWSSLAEELLPAGNRNVITDVAAAAEAARAAAVTAQVNIEVNLRGIKDAGRPGRAGGHGRGHRRGRRPRRPGGRRRARGDQPVTGAVRTGARGGNPRRDRGRGGRTRGRGQPPRLAVVTATDDEASAWYVRSIAAAAAKAGIGCEVEDLGPRRHRGRHRRAAERSLSSGDPTVHGIILPTPLPGGARLAELASRDRPGQGRGRRQPRLAGPPHDGPAGLRAGHRRGGAPAAGSSPDRRWRGSTRWWWAVRRWSASQLAHLLLDRNATVTICHSRTRDLAAITVQADVLVVAAGRVGLIGPDHVAPGRHGDRRRHQRHAGRRASGRRRPEASPTVAGALSPVPGGVGPVTTALLLRHVTDAASG